ncbi:hypothetical protein CEXT_751051 [Caerostris extrusa]|uniref:Uncharacterized protein n=1 Tax=Caerostris extrusa TaxID=172846 RepID=A0AAV4U0V7_CAEEX|nr:hypothetical protein CEXT_751051 [Caerostris extrusa]
MTSISNPNSIKKIPSTFWLKYIIDVLSLASKVKSISCLWMSGEHFVSPVRCIYIRISAFLECTNTSYMHEELGELMLEQTSNCLTSTVLMSDSWNQDDSWKTKRKPEF